MFMLEKTLSCLYTMTKIKCIIIYTYFFSFIGKYSNRTMMYVLSVWETNCYSLDLR